MSSTSPSRARVSSAIFAIVAFVAAMSALGAPARAVPVVGPPAPVGAGYWFTGAKLIFQRARLHDGQIAVASDDPGLGRLLVSTRSTIAFDPTQKYVIIGTADRRNISFALGDEHYTVGDVAQIAPFAPFAAAGVAYLPLSSILEAFHVAPVVSLDQTILQPQLAGIDVQSMSLATVVTLHGATPLRFKRISDSGDDHLTLALLGVGSSLPTDRPVSGVGLTGITLAYGGTPRNPTVVLSFAGAPGGSYVLVPSKSPNDLTLAFAPEGTRLGGTIVPNTGDTNVALAPLVVHGERTYVPPAPPVPPPATPRAVPTQDSGAIPLPPIPLATPYLATPYLATTPVAAPGSPAPLTPATGASAPGAVPGMPSASVGTVEYAADGLGLSVAVGMTGGPVPFQFHRLPDNRWYVDLRNVTLAIAPIDEAVPSGAVSALRVKQLSAGGIPITRIALTLASPRVVSLKASPAGFSIVVDPLDDLDPAATGDGTIGAGTLAAGNLGGVLSPPGSTDATDASTTPWKFGASATSGGGRLIVIDPGHGGSDDGAAHNGMREKDLTLDMSRRLKAILIAHGWQVKMTRDSDVDVFGVDASAHDELQARCDVANLANAHLFVSIHVNSFTSSDLNGTTTYYYNGQSLSLADAVHRRLIAAGLGTKNDGVRRENFYVIHHTTMPSILVETAFVSNYGDAQLLASAAWRQKMAAGIAAGIGDYDASNPSSEAFTKPLATGGGQ